jgi:Acetyltransferase (GNAT) domain
MSLPGGSDYFSTFLPIDVRRHPNYRSWEMEVPSRGDLIRGEHTWLRHAVDSDLDLLTHWFADPDVYLWWGGEPIGRDRVSADYTGHRSPEVESFIVEAEGSPIGFLQYWRATERSGLWVMLDKIEEHMDPGSLTEPRPIPSIQRARCS